MTTVPTTPSSSGATACRSPIRRWSRAILEQPDDAWHAGLVLGAAGRPESLDTVAATWMLACDAPADRASTSWRMTFDALLVRWRVLDALGFVDTTFSSLPGAALELGHRWVWQGVRLRHCPELVGPGTQLPAEHLPLADELRFVRRRFAGRWYWWSSARLARRRRWRPPRLARAAWTIRREEAEVGRVGPAAAADGHLGPRGDGGVPGAAEGDGPRADHRALPVPP